MPKGGTFERDVSRLLSLWWTKGKRDDVIWRTKNSGGVATNRKRSNKSVKLEEFGDLKSDDPIALPLFRFFSIELKTGYGKKTKSKAKSLEDVEVYRINNWAILDMVDSTQKYFQFFIFWEQAEIDAKASKREPLLIFRRNRKQACIAMYSDIFMVFAEEIGMPKFNYILVKEVNHDEIIICNLQSFLDWSRDLIGNLFLMKLKQAVTKRRKT